MNSVEVQNYDLKKMLRQVYVRPFVLLLLLYQLIDQGHEVFLGKVSAAALKEKMRAAVEKEYPETEAHVPEERRQGSIPQSILDVLKEVEEETKEQKKENRKE